jgi:phenylpyruvate tautomerase PptA (4-oxalocrotonate tautomerase family)
VAPPGPVTERPQAADTEAKGTPALEESSDARSPDHLLQGRTADQKRKIAKRITDALVEEAGARREAIIVAFNEVSKESSLQAASC